MRGSRSSGTRPARSGAPTISAAIRDARVPRRGAAVDRVGLTFHAAHARARRRPARKSGSTAAPSRRCEVGAPEGTLDRSRGPVLQPAGAPEVPEVRHRRIRPDLADRHAARAGYPDIGFALTSGARKVLQCPPVAIARERFYQLYGDRADLVAVRRQAGGITVTGFVAALAEQGPTRGPQHVFVNRRIVKDRTIAHAIIEAYSVADDQGAQSRGASVHRDAARRAWTSTCIRPRLKCASAISPSSTRCSGARLVMRSERRRSGAAARRAAVPPGSRRRCRCPEASAASYPEPLDAGPIPDARRPTGRRLAAVASD